MSLGLLDIGPLSESIELRGKNGVATVEVSGISAGDLFYLINTFPNLKAIAQGKVKDLTVEKIVKLGSRTVGMIIACAVGSAGDEKVAEFFEKRSLGDQIRLLNKVFEFTFTEGVGPFVDQMKVLTQTFTGMNREPSAMASPAPSRAALQVDTALKSPGPTRLAN